MAATSNDEIRINPIVPSESLGDDRSSQTNLDFGLQQAIDGYGARR